MKKLLFFIPLFISFLLFAKEPEIPTLRNFVTDQTGVLSQSEAASIEQKLYAFDQKTGTQILVLIIPTLEENTIEDFTFKVVEKNKIGQKKSDNGVLLTLAIKERKLRIEVGYGLEGAITDALCSQIIRNIIVPELKSNNFAGGIDKGTDALISYASGETFDMPESRGEKSGKINTIVFILIIPMLLFAAFLKRKMNGFAAWSISTGIFGVISYLILFSLGATLFASFIYAIISIFVLFGAKGGGTGFGGGFYGGGYGGGSSFGGGDSGGFSGGGGSFGGGGSSGDW